MNTLKKKTVTTSRGFSYTYYTSTSLNGKPTILLLHGWPDHAALWEDLATRHLTPQGYGVIIPDCLGHGDTSKPTDPDVFNSVGLTGDFIDILDAEHVEKVVSSGHDWGSGLAHRFYVFHPKRCSGLITLNYPASPPPQGPIVMDQLAQAMIRSIGYFPGWYWTLFSDPAIGPALLNQHTESLFTALHAEPMEWMNTLCAKDGLKSWLELDKKGPVQEYATNQMREQFIKRMEKDGYESSLCYYQSLLKGGFYEQDSRLPAERYKIDVPYLFIAGKQDVVCRPQAIKDVESLGLVPRLTVKELDVGHWCMLAKPEEVGKYFVEWLGDNY
ncbi:Alpha/Beta hydrolase protein [Trichoderma evansii]